MIIELLYDLGGRGSEYTPPGEGSAKFSANGLGSKVSDTLKGAIGTKGAAIPMQTAYKDANPNFDKSGTYAEYTQNCQRCVVAYELRRRGYDVTALPTYEGDTLPTTRVIGNTKWGRWQGAFQKASPENVGGRTTSNIVNNIEKRMKSFGDGARGVVSVTYKKSNRGHVFNVEQRKGRTYFVDAQTGERMWIDNFMKIVNRSTVTLTRTDNLRISERAKNFVTAENAYKRR